jgi:dTMP kinase
MRRGGANRYDHAELAYHQELRAGFLEIARAEPGRCVVVDGSRGEGEVAADVWSAVAARLVVGA